MGFYVHFSHWMIEGKKMNGIKPMADCEECGKNLGIFEGYRHPTLGKKHLLCSTCFDTVSESVDRWREFVMANSFNKASSNMGLEFDLKKIFTKFSRKHENYGNYIKLSMEKQTKRIIRGD